MIVAAAVGATATRARAAEDPSCGTMAVVMRQDALVYRLPRTFLRPGSERVVSRGLAWHVGVDYVFDFLRGEFRLLHDPLPGDTVWVTACGLINAPPLDRYRLELRPPGSLALPTADTAQRVSPRAGVSSNRFGDVAGVNLAVSGSKSLAIDFGSNQDAFLRQSLDLTVSGNVAPGVELTGVLSDRNTPLSAEGSTRDLQTLDRVLLELKSATTTVQLGDVDVAIEQGEFGRVRRHLQGINAGYRRGAQAFQLAAASAPGEYRRFEFLGTEGYQGPYALEGLDAATAVVRGSEIVTLDGDRMSRGGSADYAMDYDAGRITFTNRRSITASSRIAVQYQRATSQYQRRLVSASGRVGGPNAFVYSGLVSESDDRGRPTTGTLGVQDIATLSFAGDSASRAILPEVTAGGGDYDTTRVGSGVLTYVYVGPAAGRFTVPFANVGVGNGDYEAFPVAAGTAYRYLGENLGAYRLGRLLALPQSHQLVQLGGGLRAGSLKAEAEVAVSRFDANTFSPRDDGNNVGGGARGRIGLETTRRDGWLRRAGLVLSGRGVEQRFVPFERLSDAFEGERWGLARAADLDRRREGGVEAYLGSPTVGELSGTLGRLTTPSGFDADRRELNFRRDGRLATRAAYAWAHGSDPAARHPDGGRERMSLRTALRMKWLEPAVTLESDARRAPTDSLASGTRTRSGGIELASGERFRWHASAGVELRRDALASSVGFSDQGETRVARGSLRSPEQSAWGGEVRFEHRALEPLAAPVRTRSELGGLRLRAEQKRMGLRGNVDLEIAGDGESRRERRVVFVGTGAGSYDALGNFVGTGDYTVVIVVAPEFDRISRATTSAHAGWEFAPAPAWRGSRAGFDFESETRRRGDLAVMDPWVAPGVVLHDVAFARASLRQRFETELAPGARAMALRFRLERQVSADRAFQNFAQTLDRRSAALRWRTRPGKAVTTELEGALRREAADQVVSGGASRGQTIEESSLSSQLIVTPGPRLRTVAAAEAVWSRAQGAVERTRTLRIGPDVGFDIGSKGHAELGLRRGFVGGAPPVSLLPSRDPAGPARWDASGRLDYRVRASSTASATVNAIERAGQRTVVTGRAELRAFF